MVVLSFFIVFLEVAEIQVFMVCLSVQWALVSFALVVEGAVPPSLFFFERNFFGRTVGT